MVRTIGHENRMSPTGVGRDGDRSEVPVRSRLRWRMANLDDPYRSMPSLGQGAMCLPTLAACLRYHSLLSH
jgi:hypothetical protein